MRDEHSGTITFVMSYGFCFGKEAGRGILGALEAHCLETDFI
jgi:hypothetical protein